jgi:hypothetical protein
MAGRNPWNDAHQMMGAMTETIRRGYQVAKAHGYTGSSLQYAMDVAPATAQVLDRDEHGRVLYEGPLDQAPSVESLLARLSSESNPCSAPPAKAPT